MIPAMSNMCGLGRVALQMQLSVLAETASKNGQLDWKVIATIPFSRCHTTTSVHVSPAFQSKPALSMC